MHGTARRLLGLRLGLALLFAFTGAAGALPAPGAVHAADGELVILPITRAKLLAGQRFDFRVEANKLSAKPTAWNVTINGQDAGSVLGKAGTVSNSFESSQEQTFADVALREPGEYTVTATATVAGQTLTKTVKYTVAPPVLPARRARNVVLFIGDGMSLPMRTAARIVGKGIDQGKYNSMLEMDDMDAYAVLTTSGMDGISTDSANSASAYATGHKSVVNAMGVYPGNTAEQDPNQQPRVENLGELVKRTRGMGYGLVTTAEIQDATPAAFSAHTRRRSEYLEIMDQFLQAPRMPDVLMGGGSASLLPQSVAGSRRKDDRDLFKEFEQRGFSTATTRAELNTVGTPDKLLGLFHLGNMNVYLDRAVYKNPNVLKQFTDQPSLMEMTSKALSVLEKNENGFFLMVEGASIDKQAHPLDWWRTVYDVLEMDKTVGLVKQWSKDHGDDTLIIVTADHSHGMSITGTYWDGDGKSGREGVRIYQDAKFPDFVDADGDGFPDQVDVPRTLAINWANHPEYYHNYRPTSEPLVPAIKDGDNYVANPARNVGPADLFPPTTPTGTDQGVHTVEDVPLTARGPGAEQFRRTMDNTELFFAIANALGLDAREGRSPFTVAGEEDDAPLTVARPASAHTAPPTAADATPAPVLVLTHAADAVGLPVVYTLFGAGLATAIFGGLAAGRRALRRRSQHR